MGGENQCRALRRCPGLCVWKMGAWLPEAWVMLPGETSRMTCALVPCKQGFCENRPHTMAAD